MTALAELFNDRVNEVEIYLDLLEAIDEQVKNGKPQLGDGWISAPQQHILYSAVYLQLYNLVEVTVTRCVLAVYDASSDAERWTPADLSDRLLEEWIRLKADTRTALNEDNRLRRALALARHLIDGLPVSWPADAHLAGNWDDGQIERMSARLGCELQISAGTNEAVKRPIRDDMGQLALIRERRNRLAHGNLSFAECGAEVTVAELRRTKECTVLYLQEVIDAFEDHINSCKFLREDRRYPAAEIGLPK
ncbi:MAG: MAE_28990/MAE_18760 family HEPN-like nuclease [Chloroflexota bacterium]|nr:MAE_28990/MAE_18760 family HEPN-like nuclease [Chloroflexota bacterium]